jgi:hypothetical protein
MVHTAVVLPRILLERMRTDAERSGRGLSTEIRERLQMTYEIEGLPDDPETRDLLACVKTLAINLNRDLGQNWHKSQYGKDALHGGWMTFLGEYVPEGDEGVRKFGNPNTHGITRARAIIEARGEENKS